MSWDLAESGFKVVIDSHVSTMVREDLENIERGLSAIRLYGIGDLLPRLAGAGLHSLVAHRKGADLRKVDPHADKFQPGNGIPDFAAR